MKRLFKKLFPSKEMRAYRKMHRKHRKELIRHAKETYEFDWSWLYESTIMQIKHMYEYYSAGNNVYQSEESLNPIIEQLKHVLDLADELDHLWDGHYESIKNADGSITTTEESANSYRKKNAREEELYEEIYSYIGKYIQWWWD
jgi:hypothetical protein